MGKTAILSLRIIGDAVSGQKAAQDTSRAFDKMTTDVEKSTTAMQGSSSRGFAGIGEGAQIAESKLGGVYTWLSRIVATLTILGGLSLGAALGSGLQRYVSIENAQTSLSVILQDGGKAKVLLDQIKEVVNGTPFNFDQFATAGKNLVAMNVPAEKVPGYLRAIGEAAAASGKGSEGVSRISDAFGKMAAQGTVSLDQVWSVSDAGVNALAILGNRFGKTTDDMKKMISTGTVPAREAMDALASGIMNGSDGIAGKTISLSGTMAGLRDTMEGAWGGMNASIARFGEAIITAAAPALKDLMNGVTTFVNELTTQAGPALKMVVDFFTQWGPVIGPALAFIITFTGVFLTWVKVVAAIQAVQAAMAALNLVMAANPIGLVVSAIAAMVAGLLWAYTNVEEFRNVVDGMGRFVMDVFANIGKAIDGMIGWIRDAIGWFNQLGSSSSSAQASPAAANASADTQAMGRSMPTQGMMAFAAVPASAPSLPRFNAPARSLQPVQNVTNVTNNFTVEAAYDRAGTAQTIQDLLNGGKRANGVSVATGGGRW